MRVLVAIAALALLAASPAHAQETASPVLPDLEDEVMCPTCGTALGLSESPQASQIRALIRRLDSEGRSKEEIKDALVVEYGSEILAVPDTSGFDLAAWLIPGGAILIAGAALGIGVRRWRRDPGNDHDDDTAAAAGDPGDEQRLQADLERYRL